MATLICAGIVALMKEKDPTFTPDQIKTFLMPGTDLWEDREHNKYGGGNVLTHA